MYFKGPGAKVLISGSNKGIPLQDLFQKCAVKAKYKLRSRQCLMESVSHQFLS